MRLMTRNGNDVTDRYPELAALGDVAHVRSGVFDGEIVATDAAGRPDFGLLQERMNLVKPGEIAAARRGRPGAPVPLRRARTRRRRPHRPRLLGPADPARERCRRRAAGLADRGARRLRRRRRERHRVQQGRSGSRASWRRRPSLPLRGGPPVGGLDQDQAPLDAGGRDRRLAHGQGQPRRHLRLPARRSCRLRGPALRRPGRQRIARPGPRRAS